MYVYIYIYIVISALAGARRIPAGSSMYQSHRLDVPARAEDLSLQCCVKSRSGRNTRGTSLCLNNVHDVKN